MLKTLLNRMCCPRFLSIKLGSFLQLVIKEAES